MHRAELTVRFYELDPYGHVNHAVYLSYFEAARVEALEVIGAGLDRLREDGLSILAVEAQARFHRPARLGDRLTVETELVTLRTVSSRWRQEMSRDGEPVASLELRAAIADLHGRPCRLPAVYAERLAALQRRR